MVEVDLVSWIWAVFVGGFAGGEDCRGVGGDERRVEGVDGGEGGADGSREGGEGVHFGGAVDGRD